MARSSPFWDRTGTTSTTPAVIYLPPAWRSVKLWVDALSYAQLGATYAAPAVADVNGVTTLLTTGAPTGGTFTLIAFPNDAARVETGTVAYNGSAANTKSALTGTSTFASGDISAGGGALPTAVTLTWTGVYAATVPPLVVGTNALTGGTDGQSVQIRVTTNPLGHGGYGYVEANTQETWENDGHESGEPFLYVATVASTGNYRITAYR